LFRKRVTKKKMDEELDLPAKGNVLPGKVKPGYGKKGKSRLVGDGESEKAG